MTISAVIFKSGEANLTITAIGIVPTTAASSLKWKIDRDTADTGLSGNPTLNTTSGATLTVTPNTSGNFRLICYVDKNGNGAYDSGEELKVLRLVIVETTIDTSNCLFTAPTASNPGTFVVNSQQNGVDTANAMTLTCEVILKSGGTDRRVGLDKAHLGNVGNLITDNFTIHYPIPIPTPAPPGDQAGTVFEAPNGRATNSSEWFPLPMVDTSRVTQGHEPTGAGSPFRGNSGETSSPRTGGGQTRTVTSLDSPGYGFWSGNHPVTNNIWQTTTGGNTFREFIVGYSDSFNRTYVTIAKGEWQVLVIGINSGGFVWQSGTGASINIQSTISSQISENTPQNGDASGVQVLGSSFVREFLYKHTP